MEGWKDRIDSENVLISHAFHLYHMDTYGLGFLHYFVLDKDEGWAGGLMRIYYGIE